MNPFKHFNPLALLAALTAVALAVGIAACGGNSDSNSSSAGNGTDLAFIDGMIPHHQSAIDMAKTAQKRGQSDFVKQLANDIVSAQEGEITVMNAAKHDIEQAGVKKADLGLSADKMGMNMDDSMLKTAKPFDKAFIDMMVPHHQGAIRMARIELAKGKSPALTKLAQNIVDAQSREIRAMNEHRKMMFGAPSPAGGVPSADESPNSGGMDGMDHSNH